MTIYAQAISRVTKAAAAANRTTTSLDEARAQHAQARKAKRQVLAAALRELL